MKWLAFPILLLISNLPSLNSRTQLDARIAPLPSIQQPPQSAAASPPPVTEQIRTTVGFLQVFYGGGTPEESVVGTCFFVALPDKRLGEDQSFVYLVTNRHVAQPGIDLGVPHVSIGALLRLNLVVAERGAQSATIPIPIDSERHWFFPSDDAVDLAILPLAPDGNRFAYRNIPVSMIESSDAIKTDQVGAGDPVVFAGYFSSFPGQIRMEPIVREGVIAMLPGEKLQTTLHKEGHVILADLHAFHGNSGSPVFVNLGGFRHGSVTAGEKYILLGILSGYYPESAQYSVPAASVLTGEVHDNSGIAAIVPAEELMNLLNTPELQKFRERIVTSLPKKP